MRHVRRAGVHLATALAAGAVAWEAAAPAAAARWARPVPGDVVAPFTYDRRTPFAPGQRRGVRLRARAGRPVRAACGGAVVFAGPTPDGARAVTIRCGRWRVTHLGLAADFAQSPSVPAGAPVGRAAGSTIGLGVRHADDPFGYVNPLRFLPAAHAPPVGPVPAARRRPPAVAPRNVPRDAARRPADVPSARSPELTPARSAPPQVRLPWTVWAGVGALLAGTLAGVRVGRVRRRPHRSARTAAGT